MKQFGVGNWTKISQQVPTRTSVQCRERWVNVLDERIKRGPWGEEEEARLKQLCEEYEGRRGKVGVASPLTRCREVA